MKKNKIKKMNQRKLMKIKIQNNKNNQDRMCRLFLNNQMKIKAILNNQQTKIVSQKFLKKFKEITIIRILNKLVCPNNKCRFYN